MQRISNIIASQREKILTGERLCMTTAQWDNLLTRLERFYDKIEKKKAEAMGKHPVEPECYDEQIWTFLVACGYAAGGDAGLRKIAGILTGDQETLGSPLWMEALPYPPRVKEGNTNLDLACGAIGSRGLIGTKNDLGIKYRPGSDAACDHIVFCEMKWYSDISKSVTHHQQRNQLARVIENAITFQDELGAMPAICTVTLVTPAVFQREPKSRLYHYKFDEYRTPENKVSAKALLAEFDHCGLGLMKPRRNKTGWNYPESIESRLSTLTLNWVTFEELIEGMPESPLGEEIRRFHSLYNKSCPP